MITTKYEDGTILSESMECWDEDISKDPLHPLKVRRCHILGIVEKPDGTEARLETYWKGTGYVAERFRIGGDGFRHIISTWRLPNGHMEAIGRHRAILEEMGTPSVMAARRL